MPYSASDLFTCKRCGCCCKGYGGTFVTDQDIRNIAAYMGKERRFVVDTYCQGPWGRRILIQGADGYCVFWDKDCRIHPVKPRMCRRWPFIESVLRDVENWLVMGASCPGIRTDLPDHIVTACVKAELELK